MPTQTREVRPSQKPGHVQTSAGVLLAIPGGWALLPPGDAALSRRIKADGPTWTVLELKGNKRFSRGIWAPADRIDALRAGLAAERTDPAYQKKLDAGRARRAAQQEVYAEDFCQAVVNFLAFHPRYRELAVRLARAITDHAVPVGSGTVARTERIPVEQRAEAATLAWMRHQTTAYDHMTIPRVKGMRREVRRMLAQRSRQLLAQYRSGSDPDAARCPLQQALGA
ncbi:hypothetical protein OPIT5_15290 [Opitutaceae bacterium TAV5]|nr:hypothetical protein OPIT5_15290 [Opitutaceae bacterium TAV5]